MTISIDFIIIKVSTIVTQISKNENTELKRKGHPSIRPIQDCPHSQSVIHLTYTYIHMNSEVAGSVSELPPPFVVTVRRAM